VHYSSGDHICERGLAFRGDNETIGSANNGNYLGLMELVAEYDDFLKQHMEKHGNRGSGHTSYLSTTISEEFIELMGKRCLKSCNKLTQLCIISDMS